MSTVTLDPLTFANLLKTPDVTNALHKVLSPLIELSIAEALKPVQQSFDAKFQQLTASVNMLNSNATASDKLISDLKAENTTLKDRLTTLEAECDAQSQCSRRDNLLFSGIQAITAEVAAAAIGHLTVVSSESVTNKIIAFCHDNFSVDVTRSDISIAHQLTSKCTTGEQAIIVRFVNRSTRDKVYHARTKLRAINQGKQLKEMFIH